jgi:uncharacterized protein (DUF2235 family)
MALYAFDGTWNKDNPGTEQDTNVLLFSNAYHGEGTYWPGVGTRFGLLGRVAGGITGAGGLERVQHALDELKANFRRGDSVIDVIGFSRGAALALHFTNQIQQRAKKMLGLDAPPPVRFLGLWDTVASFGIPGNDLNPLYDLGLPDHVEKCYHAMALDERRHTFPLQRLEARVADVNQTGRLFEVWFRGVHSDIGGGNKNSGLSSIALQWMYTKAKEQGLPLDDNRVAAASGLLKPSAPISASSFDPVKNRFRVVRWNDSAHETVAARPDTKDREHNPIPANLARVNDAGAVVA